MFSPYYAAARRRTHGGNADPAEHCAVNVALYSRGGARRWAMTERGSGRSTRSACTLQIGPSAMMCHGDTMTISLDEVTAPWPSRVRGIVTLHAGAWASHPIALDAQGAHRWGVLAPCGRVEVALSEPALRWSGLAYLDGNCGDAPLESAFNRWDWSRAHLRDGGTAVFYDVQRRDGSMDSWALRFGTAARGEAIAAPALAELPATAWRLQRRARSDGPARIERTLESGPFYARSLVDAQWFGEQVRVVHESVSLRRFEARWVQALLPFRMPRRAR